MKSKIHLKLLMAPLSMLVLLSCTPDQYQQTSEYDDVYFTSADRKTVPRVVVKSEAAQTAEAQNIITLSNESKKSIDPNLISRYNNSETKEVEYFVEGEGGPRVTKASELNYADFLWDYENELLATYALPVDWADEWDEVYFNNLVSSDFEFSLAWYDQYYIGNSTRMDRYISAANARVARTSMATFRQNPRLDPVFFSGGFLRPSFSVGIGFGRGFGMFNTFGARFGRFNSFGDPFFDPFIDPFFDPFFGINNVWVGGGGRFWNRGFRRNIWGFGGGFYDPFYCPPIFSNQYIYRGEVLVANRIPATRGGRLSSTSVASVRSDAVNGVAQTRSQRLASSAGTTRVSRSSIANRTSSSGRVSSSSSSRSGLSRSTVSRSSSSRSQVASTRSSRVRTDAYRFNDSRSSSRPSSTVRSSSVRGDNRIVSSRTSRSSSSRSSAFSGRSSSRSSSSRNSSGVSFNRSSSRSSSAVRSSSSSRSSSSRSGVSRSRSSSSRSSGSVSRGSSSRSSGSVSRSSGSSSRSSSSRSSGSVSRSSSSRSSGSVSRSSSSSSRSSSSSSGSRRSN